MNSSTSNSSETSSSRTSPVPSMKLPIQFQTNEVIDSGLNPNLIVPNHFHTNPQMSQFNFQHPYFYQNYNRMMTGFPSFPHYNYPSNPNPIAPTVTPTIPETVEEKEERPSELFNAKTGIRRRRRTAFSEFQIQKMKEKFNKDPFFRGDQLKKLSSEIGVDLDKIRIWFKNQRALKRKNSPSDSMKTIDETP